jgi:hypothetical protein
LIENNFFYFTDKFIWQSGFRGKDFLETTNQKQELSVAAMFVNGSELNDQSL